MKKELTGEQEDEIFKVKDFIDELNVVIDSYFKKLVKKLELNEKGEEWFFDYIYNDDSKSRGFSDYLFDYEVDESTIFIDKTEKQDSLSDK